MRFIPSTTKGKLFAGGVFSIAILTTWFLASLAVAHRLTSRSAPRIVEKQLEVSWSDVESHQLSTTDGETIGAWLFPGDDDLPCVILLHANGGSRRSCLGQAKLLRDLGYSVLAITHRCHGDSTGERNDFGRSASGDVVAAVELLESERPGRPILIHGISLGAASAIFAAGELRNRVDGYVLECPYRDLKTSVRNRTRLYLPPVLDLAAYWGLLVAAPCVLEQPGEIAPINAMSSIPEDVPVLIMAGEFDQHATPAEAEDLRAEIADHCDLIVVPEGRHARLYESNREVYVECIQRVYGR